MASLIQHQAPQITQRLDLLLGEGAVTKLRIVQGPVKAPAAPSPPGPAASRRWTPPRSATWPTAWPTSPRAA